MPLLADSRLRRSLEFRLAFIPLAALAASLLYQGTNAALYHLIGLCVYFWAFSEGEVSLWDEDVPCQRQRRHVQG